MKAIIKIFNGNKEINKEILKNEGIFEEVFDDIQRGLKEGKSYGEYDNKISWSLYVSK